MLAWKTGRQRGVKSALQSSHEKRVWKGKKFAAFEGPGLDLRNSPDIFYALNAADFSASASCMKSRMAFR